MLQSRNDLRRLCRKQRDFRITFRKQLTCTYERLALRPSIRKWVRARISAVHQTRKTKGQGQAHNRGVFLTQLRQTLSGYEPRIVFDAQPFEGHLRCVKHLLSA